MTVVAAGTESQLENLLVELIRLVTQRTAGQTLHLMLDAELSMPQVVTLFILQRCGPKSVSAIAARLQLSLAATSQLVDGLVRRNFVARQEDSLDRRVKIIALLPPGAKLLDQLTQSRIAEMAAGMALLPDALRDQATTALASVVAHLREMPDAMQQPAVCDDTKDGRRKTDDERRK